MGVEPSSVQMCECVCENVDERVGERVYVCGCDNVPEGGMGVEPSSVQVCER